MEQIEFDPEDAPKVLTGISPECQIDDCEECPQFTHYEGKQIFCVHACHRAPESELPKE
jgi:hypothetical protein